MSADAESPDTTVPPAGGTDVMASVDRGAGAPTYVIADVSVDDAWVAVPNEKALPLHAWR